MKLEKAIEIGAELREIVFIYKSPKRKDALSLLIEAGKRVEHTRHEAPEFVIPLLPGETEE